MSLRERMPLVAAWIDELRLAFGIELVNEWIRGRDGGALCASENGVRWCTPGRTCVRCKGECGGK
jgi:hypothetical protein